MDRRPENTGDPAACPVCGSTATEAFLDMPRVPVFCNVLWDTREDATGCDRGDITLRLCGRCTFVYNGAFDPELVRYTPRYDNCLHFSGRFREYAGRLAADLVEKHGLRGKTVIDVGCGKGDFLKMLCELGPNRGIGYDPSFEDRDDFGTPGGDIRIIRDYYSERYAGHGGDFLSCRHVLEHIEKPAELLERIRAGLGNRSGVPVFFEVPNGEYTVRNVFVWDVIYEHPGYFTPESARFLFASNGFDAVELHEEFEGQYLGVHARTAPATGGGQPPAEVDSGELRRLAERFSGETRSLFDKWTTALDASERMGKKTVIWGAGSKGVTFLNLLDPDGRIRYAVDVSPSKHGRFIAGTGQEIVTPDFLRGFRPDDIVVMNPVYEEEIRTMVRTMGLESRIVCL
jgi:hypothetical protein